MTKFITFATVLLFLSIAASAQTPTPTPVNKDEKDVVKISTTLIQIDATVLDKKGNIVRNLKPEDFEVYENGKRQPITTFSFVERQTSTQTAPVESNKQANNDKQANNASSVPPVPMRLRPEQVRRTISLVVDDLGLSFAGIDKVKTALKKYVDDQMQTGDLVAIVRTGGGAGFLQQFTNDKRILYRAIEKLRWNPAGSGKIDSFPSFDTTDNGAPTYDPSDRALGIEVADNIRREQGKSKIYAAEKRNQFNSYKEDVFAVGSLGAINYVIRGMQELPGRKAVVLFSEGFGLYDLDNGIKKPNPRLMDAFQRLTELASRSSVVIYAMDTRGVVNGLMLNAADNVENLNQEPDAMNEIESSAISRSTELFETQQGLRALAEQTGGFAIINNNNLTKGIERVLNDQNGYYLLGYQPEEQTFDPKTSRFNKLEIRLKNPELRVRYRSGFFGIEDKNTNAAGQTANRQLLSALTSPFKTSAVSLNLNTVLISDKKNEAVIRSIINIDANDLKFTRDATGKRIANIDLVAVTFSEDGKAIEQFSRNYTISLTEERYRNVLKEGFVYDMPVPIRKPGIYQFRIAVFDSGSKAVGSVSSLITVPNLKKNFALSGIVLDNISQKSASNPSKNYNNQADQSDLYLNMSLRKFKRGTILHYGYLIYNAKADSSKIPQLQVQTRLFSGEQLVFETKPALLNLDGQTDMRHIENVGSLLLGNNLKAGDYVLQVLVTDLSSRGQNRTISQWIDFEVTD